MGDRQQPMRAIAAGVMLAVENGQSLSQCLPPALNRLPGNERPELQALCYGTCRWFHRLEGELNGRLKKPLRKPDRVVHHLMLVALFQLRFSQQATYAILNETVEACRALDKPHLTGLVNGVLRAAEREGAPEPADDSARFSHPVWMVEKLRREGRYGFLFANGGFATDNHCIVLGKEPIAAASFPQDFDYQAEAEAKRGPVPDLVEDYAGPATIESYTIFYGRDGAPRAGVVVARTPAGERTLAHVDVEDAAMLAFLTDGKAEPVGAAGQIVALDEGFGWRAG